jgi:ABC-type maltose transport system permease subunit
MSNHHKAIIAAFLAASVINFLGVVYFFAPIAASDHSASAILPQAIAFLIYVALSVALYDWAATQMQSAGKAAFVVGASQFILVNVDYVLTGKRGIITAGASTVLMVATWVFVAFAYSRFRKWSSDRNDA